MAKQIKGSLDICKNLKVGRRVIQAQNTETITATEVLTVDSHYRQRLTAAAAQDVTLPDATTLQNADAFEIEAITSALTVKDDGGTTIKVIQPGRTYKFTLTENGSADGTWHVNYLEQADIAASARHVETFDATTDWGVAAGGIYTQTILQATHLRGVAPQVDLFEGSGPDFIEVGAEVKVKANGDIEITVPETPNCRFAGRAVII